LFERQAARTPDRIALVYRDEQLTYAELNRRANRLAHRLIELGVGPEVRVGILCDRSIEMVVGLLGTLKAGGAYVPLDPTYPAERLFFMLKDAELKALLVEQEAQAALAAQEIEVVGIREASQSGENEENPRVRVSAENIAYIIYTSGSTGLPKGAMISHGGIANHMAWMLDSFPMVETDTDLQKTPFSFDASVWEFYAPLLSGARLVMARPAGHLEPRYLIDTIREHGVTRLQVVPTLLQALLQEESFSGCGSLKRVFCGGEALPKELLTKFFETLPDTELLNLYGPTETTIEVTYWHCERDTDRSSVPIGRAIANTQLYILDNHLQPVPIGVAGHLHIGGASLGRGYFNRPELTADRFIPNPFSVEPGTRLYRTGDLARYLPDGSIEYMGRSDHQVKLRGYRIELGEIEAALSEYPLVRQCVVIVREDVPGDKRLVAYLVPEASEDELEGQSVRRFLQQQLPEYMIPQSFVILEALPLSPSGKLDRRALPAPEQGRLSEESYVAPRSKLEEVLCSIWAEVLKVERVGVEDNFFDLGGHSLLATQVINRVRESFQAEELPLRKLFEEPTVAALAVCVAEEVGGQEIAEEIAETVQQLEEYSAEEVAALLAQQEA
ncbi:MAG TPA: amino acid adenylation domain-containing protein, partial [Pyrinomonadaceae bacterium]|nr:amino acid adenylation domain-containing protein [Pyrinomonadaceae bacterium]